MIPIGVGSTNPDLAHHRTAGIRGLSSPEGSPSTPGRNPQQWDPMAESEGLTSIASKGFEIQQKESLV